MEHTNKDKFKNNIIQINLKLDKCENIVDTNKNITKIPTKSNHN